MSSTITKTAEYWSKNAGKFTQSNRGMLWIESPEIHAHINRKVSGSPDINWLQHSIQVHLNSQIPVANCLSLGCGEGRLERSLFRLGTFQVCDAYDVAPGSIDLARKQTEVEGIKNINYYVADINTLSLPENRYDVVWVDMAMHHFEALEYVYQQISRTLRPNGWLFMNEYVGPNRFQFSSRQKEIINLCLRLIPDHYRVTSHEFTLEETQRAHATKDIKWFAHRFIDKIRDGDLLGVLQRRLVAYRAHSRGQRLERTSIAYPSERDLMAADPTEAIRSSDIIPVLQDHFRVVEIKPWGGNVLHFLLSGIVGNFSQRDPNSLIFLNALIELEDAFLACGEMKSDFAYIAACPL